MSKTAKCCGNCKFAKWERTKTGRISRVYAGQCQYTVVLPECYAKPFLPKRNIWPDDGMNCECFEAKV